MERQLFFRTLRLVAVLALALAAAPAVHAQHLGTPTLRVDTYKITPYYDAEYDTSITASLWPAVHDHQQRTQAQKDANGRIALHSVYDASSFDDDIAAAWADDTGLLGASSRRDDTYAWDELCGVLTNGLWAQSFTKDAADASLTLYLSGAQAYALAWFGQARAEFTFEARATRNGSTFFSHREVGAVRGSFGFPTVFDQVVEGQMTVTSSNPNGNGTDQLLNFASIALPVDLSSVPLGGEFTLRCNLVTEASIGISEVAKAHVTFGDEATATGGMQLATFGLTPTNNPVLPPQPVGVERSPAGARTLALSAPRPNPSPAGASFELELGRGADVAVDVFDLSGRRVAALTHGALPPGRHALGWNGRDASGAPAAPGLYTVRAVAGGEVVARRVVKLAAGR
ncbi:MAG: FlgD immunoglobulin-like domain containing protein [Candidatus Eisenbacteria bacterium]